ncbi:MAG: hypothetical protein SXV54_03260 [Chloroflexota bacterium]|nr:hypothetical protein [Chloroflexota bacterium]
MTDQELWRPDDPAWMKARKAEWRHVQKSLDVMRLRISKKDQRHHKELFFFNRVDPGLVAGRMEGGEPFDSAFCFFEMWYHPEVSLQTRWGQVFHLA